MPRQQHEQFTLYPNQEAIPGYQRAWVWGSVALLILLCGVVVGAASSRSIVTAFKRPAAATTITEQEQRNAQLRERITQIEQALNTDPCSGAAAEALRLENAR